MLRKLGQWLRRQWNGTPLRTDLPEEELAIDIDEFARLLQSGKPEDLEAIAKTLTRPVKIKT